MEKIKNLLGQGPFDRSKFIGPETLEAQTERKAKRLEYNQQVAEVLLEEGEKIFWHSGNLDIDEIQDLIIQKAEDRCAKLSELQKKALHKIIMEWTWEVGQLMEVIDELTGKESNEKKNKRLESREKRKNKVQDLSQDDEFADAPWKLLEKDETVQLKFLEWLPVKNKDPKKFIFHVDCPPFIVIQCLDSENYNALSVYDEKDKDIEDENGSQSSTLGQAFVCQAPIVEDVCNEIKGLLWGKIAISMHDDNVSDESTITHEIQHLIYTKFIQQFNQSHTRALDEMAAFFKHDQFELTEQNIFSDVKTNDRQLLENKYNLKDWLEVKDQLVFLSAHGIFARDLWSKVATCRDLPELLVRLKQIEVDEKKFNYAIMGRQMFINWFLRHKVEAPKYVLEKFERQPIYQDELQKSFKPLNYDLQRILDDVDKQGKIFPTLPLIVKILTEYEKNLIGAIQIFEDNELFQEETLQSFDLRKNNFAKLKEQLFKFLLTVDPIFANSVSTQLDKVINKDFDFTVDKQLEDISLIKFVLAEVYSMTSIFFKIMNEEDFWGSWEKIKKYSGSRDFEKLSFFAQTEVLEKLYDLSLVKERRVAELEQELNLLALKFQDDTKKLKEYKAFVEKYNLESASLDVFERVDRLNSILNYFKI